MPNKTLQANDALTRRELLKKSGQVGMAATAASAGLLGGKAPAFAKGSTVHVLAWSHFIKEADEYTRGTLAEGFKKATGATLKYETINANNINARATAAVESGAGPDIFQLQWNQPHLFSRGLLDHDKLGSDLSVNKQYDYLKEAATVNGTLRGVPYYGIGNANAYRKDVFAKVGIKSPPKTWDEYIKIGKKLKDDAGMPVGQTLGHTFGDAPTFAYPLLWSFGGMEVDKNGKVSINSEGTKQACDFLREFWNAACDETGLAWDDSSNNRAFFAESISSTLNGASIYFVARNNPEKAPPGMANKIGHFLNPAGTASVTGSGAPTPFHTVLPFTHCIANHSKQKSAAADYIRYIHETKAYEKFITAQKGYGLGATPDWETHPFWKEDPAVEPFRLNAKYGRNFGYAGGFNRHASEVQSKYIIVDLFARIARGEATASSIAKAQRELKVVYE